MSCVGDPREGMCICDSPAVQFTEVHAESNRTVFFPDDDYIRRKWTGAWLYRSTSFKCSRTSWRAGGILRWGSLNGVSSFIFISCLTRSHLPRFVIPFDKVCFYFSKNSALSNFLLLVLSWMLQDLISSRTPCHL